MKSLKIMVNGKSYLVEVGDLTASPFSVRVNGRPYTVEIEEDEGGMSSVRQVEREPFAAERVDAAAQAMVTTGAPRAPTVTTKEVIAPMPGTILNVNVDVGHKVSYGQELCGLEAMKMKNSIKSPADGVIAEVRIAEGQTVAYGEVLFVFQ